jgi:hypothetical protein
VKIVMLPFGRFEEAQKGTKEAKLGMGWRGGLEKNVEKVENVEQRGF